jgi:hypothetical protein
MYTGRGGSESARTHPVGVRYGANEVARLIMAIKTRLGVIHSRRTIPFSIRTIWMYWCRDC